MRHACFLRLVVCIGLNGVIKDARLTASHTDSLKAKAHFGKDRACQGYRSPKGAALAMRCRQGS